MSLEDKKKYERHLNDLLEYQNQYNSANAKSKRSIQESVFNYGNILDDEDYLGITGNAASGLFRPSFFQSDLSDAISYFRKKLDTEE